MGALLRRYWFPVATVSDLADRWTMRVRLLGEDLVLYRDRSGAFGLIGEFCPHRRASLAYGIPERDGIRCPYHGWKFDGSGTCLDQPNEPAGSAFKEKVATAALPGARAGRHAVGLRGAVARAGDSGHRRVRRRRRDPARRQGRRAVQLAADHGEFGRSDPHRVGARPSLGVRPQRQGAARVRASASGSASASSSTASTSSVCSPVSRKPPTTGPSVTR